MKSLAKLKVVVIVFGLSSGFLLFWDFLSYMVSRVDGYVNSCTSVFPNKANFRYVNVFFFLVTRFLSGLCPEVVTLYLFMKTAKKQKKDKNESIKE